MVVPFGAYFHIYCWCIWIIKCTSLCEGLIFCTGMHLWNAYCWNDVNKVFSSIEKKIHGTTTLPSFKYFTYFSDFIYSGSHVYLMVFFQVNAVKFNEYGSVVVSAGYDRSVRAFDCRSHSTEPIQVNCFFKNYIIKLYYYVVM